MKKQRVLVTGASGMLGSSLCPFLVAEGHETIFTNLEEGEFETLDVRDYEQVLFHVRRFRPTLLFHLAAETDVDRCEKDADHAYTTNTLGTENVALACHEVGAEMVYMSTGGVFDGGKDTPYTEFDTPNPVNVYARTKWEGEKIVQNLLDEYVIIRTGWLIGGGLKDKKFVAKILKRMEVEKEIPVVTDKFGSPTFTRDLAYHMIRFVEKRRFGLFHMANRGSCSRFDIAEHILKYLGWKDIVLKPISSDAFPLPAPRGRSEALGNYKLGLLGLDGMRPWQEALEEYLDTLMKERLDEGIVHQPISR